MNKIDQCLKGKSKKVSGLIKDELKNGKDGIIMTKFVGLNAKYYSYLMDDGSEDKKAKATKECVIEKKLELDNYRNCLEANQLDNKIKYLDKKKKN